MTSTYVTPAEVSAAWPGFAKLPEGEQSALIEAATDQIDARIRRSLAQQTYVEVHSGSNRPRIWLRNRPVLQVAEVLITGWALDNTHGDAWQFTPETGELLRGDGLCDPRFAPWFPAGRNNVRVTYSAGYDPIPAAVKRAAILVAQSIQVAGKANGAYKSESLGDYNYTLNDGLVDPIPPVAMSLISRYIQDEIS